MEWIALGLALVTLILGFPMMTSLVLAALGLWFAYLPAIDPSLMAQQMVSAVQPYVLLAIPLFIFAADIMTAGRTSQRLLALVQKTVGRLTGGVGVATAGAATGFGAVSGSSQATIAAIGPTMRRESLNAGYSDSHSLALLVNSAGLALLIPPSTVMIYYGSLTSTSVGDLFVAGIVPGLIIFAALAVYEYGYAKRHGIRVERGGGGAGLLTVLRRSALSLGLPVVALGTIYAGFATPTEAAALSVLYAAIVELLVYRSVKLRDIGAIAASTAMITSVIFILLAAGGAISWTISYARLPQSLAEVLLAGDPSRITILIIMSLFFIVACMFVDSLVAIAVLTPIFFPIATEVGVDPVYVGILITLQAAIGAVTPPFGVNIFTASAIFRVPYLTVVRGVFPYIAIFLGAALLFILVPEIVLIYQKIIP
ncbi:MAG TPA: TRAP transporter large permease [Ruania sp.]|nr:TRAP transporter large permease [Ruania sp.]